MTLIQTAIRGRKPDTESCIWPISPSPKMRRAAPLASTCPQGQTVPVAPGSQPQLPVRGLFRMTCLIVASAAMTNVRRIQRYQTKTRPAAP